MDEIPDLPPPILLKIAGYAHLADVNSLWISNVPIPHCQWFEHTHHRRNLHWCTAKPPLYKWCNCSGRCAGEKTSHRNDLTTMRYTITTTWRDKQLIEIYAIVPLE